MDIELVEAVLEHRLELNLDENPEQSHNAMRQSTDRDGDIEKNEGAVKKVE